MAIQEVDEGKAKTGDEVDEEVTKHRGGGVILSKNETKASWYRLFPGDSSVDIKAATCPILTFARFTQDCKDKAKQTAHSKKAKLQACSEKDEKIEGSRRE